MRAALLLPLLLAGCYRYTRLENQVLSLENARLSAELEEIRQVGVPPDYVRELDAAQLQVWLRDAGLTDIEQREPGVFLVPMQGEHVRFQLMVQLFENEKVLYLAATNYFRLEQATSPDSTVLLLTQISAMNYDLLLGKFQLNPRTGDISLSVELNLDDGIGFRTFNVTLHHLLRTADERYPDLLRAAGGEGL